MSTDAPSGRRGCKAAVIVVAITVFIGSLPILLFTGQLVRWNLQINAQRNMLLKDIDHVAVRDAGRTLLSQNSRDSRITESHLPPVLRELGPQWDYIDHRGWLLLEVGGGFHHHGLLISPLSDESTVRDDEHVAYTPLADGIWYYEDKN
ncbi:MAG: hypothetical protein ACYC0X_33830 [Pirellulaceae bacterium]